MPAAVEVLLAAGAAVDVVDRHGNTPLLRAVYCSRGEGGTIRLLLEAGADPNRDNVHGVNPRALAGRIANYDVAVHLSAGTTLPPRRPLAWLAGVRRRFHRGAWRRGRRPGVGRGVAGPGCGACPG
ncbi:hypothetical protein H4K36_01065 [Streptomyces sp. DHE7-1]|nr:hypothetical protein [Streptomyces sp. DHE7-1]